MNNGKSQMEKFSFAIFVCHFPLPLGLRSPGPQSPGPQSPVSGRHCNQHQKQQRVRRKLQIEIKKTVNQYGEDASSGAQRQSSKQRVSQLQPANETSKSDYDKPNGKRCRYDAAVGQRLQVIIVRELY